ncbi:hypothetical protein LTR09_004291 [Extremus antarcticus]|uniref:Calcofluor white hypersensitive protein n=1 Tax=Extremus antarcticus TaxID=702011 RepID=A0AAJ0DPT8_9PEZI|nr:hypothetical protein LTR09_004291 [Extremus antarcticus]
MSKRALQVGGVTALAAVGYYMYQAGGDPKAAEKRFEADAHKASQEIKKNVPGSAKEAKKEAEVVGADVQAKAKQLENSARKEGDKFDSAVQRNADAASRTAKDAEKQISAKASEAEARGHAAIDKFDNTVTQKASEAKSGISSWFGGSK